MGWFDYYGRFNFLECNRSVLYVQLFIKQIHDSCCCNLAPLPRDVEIGHAAVGVSAGFIYLAGGFSNTSLTESPPMMRKALLVYSHYTAHNPRCPVISRTHLAKEIMRVFNSSTMDSSTIDCRSQVEHMAGSSTKDTDPTLTLTAGLAVSRGCQPPQEKCASEVIGNQNLIWGVY